MENIVTPRLYLVPFKMEIVKAAMKGNAELAALLGVRLLPDWPDQDWTQGLPEVVDILCNRPLQAEWGLGSLVIHKADKTLIGNVSLIINPIDSSSVELGYRIVPSYQRQGYASEAAKVLLDWVLSQPTVQTVMAGCDLDNIASQRVLEKIGMQLIETRPKGLIWRLQKIDRIQ